MINLLQVHILTMVLMIVIWHLCTRGVKGLMRHYNHLDYIMPWKSMTVSTGWIRKVSFMIQNERGVIVTFHLYNLGNLKGRSI